MKRTDVPKFCVLVCDENYISPFLPSNFPCSCSVQTDIERRPLCTPGPCGSLALDVAVHALSTESHEHERLFATIYGSLSTLTRTKSDENARNRECCGVLVPASVLE